VTDIQKLIQSGELEQARTKLHLALKRYPDSAAQHNFLGVVEAQSRNYSLAEADLRRTIHLDPQMALAYLNL
jgi:Flp pilus assembly protein TadD